MLYNRNFFDLTHFEHNKLFSADNYVWEALHSLKNYLDSHTYPSIMENVATGMPLTDTVILHENQCYASRDVDITFGDATKGKLQVVKDGKVLEGASVIMAGVIIMGANINLGKGVMIESGALIKAPAIIGDCCEIRQGAYLRGYCLAGKRCVIGHVTEVKHTIFFDDAKAGHFAYLGDSILGNNVNLGAGTKLANLRFTKGDIPAKTPEGLVSTGLRKLGAILGDDVQTGCNSVTNPGTFISKKSMLMPNTTAPSGYHATSSLIRERS